MDETQLSLPVKQFLTAQGFEVRSEVNGCDLVACRGEEIVVVELKKSVNLTLILQGVDRQAMADAVYLAVPSPRHPKRSRWAQVVRLCRRLGLGLLAVTVGRRASRVDIVAEPGPYAPKKSARRRYRLEREFAGRSGDYNVGGSSARPLLTAYREEALRVAQLLHSSGPLPLKDIREGMQSLKAASILQKNFYGWFARVSRGVYALTPSGEQALREYREVVEWIGKQS